MYAYPFSFGSKTPEQVGAELKKSDTPAVAPKAAAEALGYTKSSAVVGPKKSGGGGIDASFGTSAAHATGRLEGKAPSTEAKSANVATGYSAKAPPSAQQLKAQTGSTLFTATQAKPEPAKAKAPAPPKGTTQLPGEQKGPLAAAGGYVPSQMIADGVSVKPQVPQVRFLGKAAPAARVDGSMTGGHQGAAQRYASLASSELDKVDPKKQIPREGPAALAVARSIAAGKPATITDGKLPKTSITKKYQIVL
jgi:hypothetical protein